MVPLIKESQKLFMEIKWTDRQYYVQDNADVEIKDMKIYFNTNHFPSLSFSGPYYKPRGTRGLSKHSHLRFDPKLGMGVCEIFLVPFYCVACTSMLYKPWISGIQLEKQERYKPVTKCTCWPVLGLFDNCNII